MNEQDRIPVTKVQRSAKILQTGVKVGINYLKHYSRKAVDPSLPSENLDRQNAADVFDSLSELKGSALKVAQMLSLDRQILPKAYAEKFAFAQYNAPPLSGPLIVRTFTRYFGKPPHEIFDAFDLKAAAAASIGQVHRATLHGKPLAVKIQYPGVAESITSDLRLIKPFALRLFDISGRDLDAYLAEVQERVLEETDYTLELKRSIRFAEACADLEHIAFPAYYPELSCNRVITMDWLEGRHLQAFLSTNPPAVARNQVGQALWDFYNFQQHELRAVHADPHPGNFLVLPDGRVGVLDFGCIKEIPEEFYEAFFSLTQPDFTEDQARAFSAFERLGLILANDPPVRREFYFRHYLEIIRLFARPFLEEAFDFSDANFFSSMYEYGERISRLPEFKKPRGSRHFIYMNRTNFGLYNILHQLGARVRTDRFRPQLQPLCNGLV